MHAFDILGDPVRRRIVELLASGERTAGDVSAVIEREFTISQPAVSAHLRVLRESGFASMRPDGVRRLYAVNTQSIQEIGDWLNVHFRFWSPRLDALGTELRRGRRERSQIPEGRRPQR
jgi:DNA-binding transcriptional ArsR family regulator